MTWSADAARAFIYRSARIVEQRLYASLFEGAGRAGVVAALAAYRNDDGGFGHGLEPDKRAPASQPLDVEIAFENLATAGVPAEGLVIPACDWLATVAAPSGAVPILLPSVAGYPRAAHFEATDHQPGVNPTAAIAAHAHVLAIGHAWVDRATEYCFGEIEAGRVPGEAHELLGLTKLVEAVPDRGRAVAAAASIAAALPAARYMKLDPGAGTYGVTPLEFAPAPDGIARSWFGDDLFHAHLDRLEEEQQTDGGWPISWKPAGEAGRWEWRGIRTLHAMRVLTAHGRLPA